MVMHSPRDAVVDIDNASKIFHCREKHPKSFRLARPRRPFSVAPRRRVLRRFKTVAAWAERYVDVKPTRFPATPAGRVLVRETREGKFTTRSSSAAT